MGFAKVENRNLSAKTLEVNYKIFNDYTLEEFST